MIATLLLVGTDIRAEPVAVVIDNGDPANRLDIAVLGDGYTASELSQYAMDVDQLMGVVLAEPPYDEYGSYINVHRIDVTSSESGADHPEYSPPLHVDTALDASYNCANIDRLICVNKSKVNRVLGRSLEPDERDIVLVLVNDPVYGGSGGDIAVASIHPAAVDLILHETGHSFGLLADEYGSGGGVNCNPSEPAEPNATKETTRELIKWNSWIDASTPVPTISTINGVPGLYQGARYCDTRLYRPTYNSLMRSLNRPFEQINSEQLVKRIYNWVSPIDAISPPESTVGLDLGESQIFGVTPLEPTSRPLDVIWLLDGFPVAVGHEYLADSAALGGGVHTLEVEVSDSTPLVRNDPNDALLETHSWIIEVPEPSLPVQLGSGSLGLSLLGRRRRQRPKGNSPGT